MRVGVAVRATAVGENLTESELSRSRVEEGFCHAIWLVVNMEHVDRNGSKEPQSDNNALEATSCQKMVTFSETRTMESFVERYHSEYVVENVSEDIMSNGSDQEVKELKGVLAKSLENAVIRASEKGENKSFESESPVAENTSSEVNSAVSENKSFESESPVTENTSSEGNSPVSENTSTEGKSAVTENTSFEGNSPVSENTSSEGKSVVTENTSSEVKPPVMRSEGCDKVISERNKEEVSKKVDVPKENEQESIESLKGRELGNLYPDVVVKQVEMIECQDLSQKRKGSRQSVGSGEGGSRKGSAGFVPEKDIDTILADVQATLIAVEGSLFQKKADELKVAVIGAGPAGLCAARHLMAEGIEAEVFEQCADIGGTWVYTEQVHSGSHIFPLHSSLYHDLWTNLPKETMQFPDFPYQEEGQSYLPSEKVLQYLVNYADHFNLHSIIKVRHQVKTVAPLGNYWSVAVEDLVRKEEVVSHFDAVMVCSGPHSIPVYPSIDGLAKFSGKQLHSRDYRRAETYSGKRVLIVGLGPSGLDITYQLQPTAKKVFVSHNRTKDLTIKFPEGVGVKPKVKSLFDKTVTFIDDTEEDFDVIIYCTGYTYNFPFLAGECGLIVDQNVSPLYKHLINIEHPTMCVIGLPKYCPHQYMVDYQVQAFLNVLLGRCELPSKEEMLAELESDRNQRLSEGQRKKDFHKLGNERTKAYMDDLTKLGNLDPVPPVMYKLFSEALLRAIRDFKGFRKYKYKIIDNENFVMEALEDRITAEGKGERTID